MTEETIEDRAVGATADHRRRLHCRKEFEPPSEASAPGSVSMRAMQLMDAK